MKKILFPSKIQQLEPFSSRFDAFRLAAEGCDVLFAMYPAGTEVEPHDHDTDNYGIITRGRLYLTIDGQEHEYGPGDWYHVKKHQMHSARFVEDTEEIEFWFEEN
ncbi:cupin domain-containing protein [Endozoicomonas sp. SM1973]|uniref:Cupin domain-containing protein n=1 Tax=Spartinivicinus marinus TaxID=2994442 RepID=A0A853IIY4_9GAMM|nr:cupin domain-containing protein [Spartinivicinus marinus]MCX4026840.1 cupin domain-containing protein [Spartinivicinus marinus]NYZ69367.1 cupin domain-containing protein [Spartinivicinus marinus]